MCVLDSKYVYHGSPEKFGKVKLKRQKRFNKEGVVIFDQESFHTTPYRWVALAYTVDHGQTFTFNGDTYYFNMAVDLYKNKEEVEIIGEQSLEHSLKKLYQNGGWLFTYDATDFFTADGLGNLEMVTDKEVDPIEVERIDDPVGALKNEGVTFDFTDLTLDKNAEERDFFRQRT